MRSPALLAAVVAAVLLLAAGARAATDEAYVTLLYGDEFVLGVRVLGKSLRDTGTTRDMVVLVSDGVSEYSRKLLQADGWIVNRITLLANPNQVRPKRFWGVYTKLKIFNMTSYKKVVYLDADTIVVKNIDDLFKCGQFCGNLKHSEKMNSGVMVVEPSETLFNDMINQVGRLPSYTGGDQGFLNSYYSDFANSRVFEPDSPLTPEPKTQRLSTLYNADVGLYMLANKWMVDEKELRVIHYTLGPLKPWDWFTAWLVKPVEIWQDIRQTLEESLPGTGGGKNPHDQLVVKILFIFPFCLMLFGYYQSCFQTNKELISLRSLCAFARRARHKYKSEESLPSYSVVGSASAFSISNQRLSNGTHSKLPPYFGAITVLVCFVSAGFSLAFAFATIPRQVMPWTGLLLMFELTFVSFFLLFGSYLRFVYRWGSMSANHVGFSNSDSSESHMGSGHQRNMSDCDMDATFYWIGMAAIATVAVLLPTILGVTALFTKAYERRGEKQTVPKEGAPSSGRRIPRAFCPDSFTPAPAWNRPSSAAGPRSLRVDGSYRRTPWIPPRRQEPPPQAMDPTALTGATAAGPWFPPLANAEVVVAVGDLAAEFVKAKFEGQIPKARFLPVAR